MSPLVPLHPDSALIDLKLRTLDRITTEQLIESLAPGKPESLKARPDGTLLDGHHRIRILKNRGVDVDVLPREIIEKHALTGD